jgi:ABC-type proline/glycine betaine transport system substrate-binding protein
MDEAGEAFAAIVKSVFGAVEAYRLENIALREMLREQGLTKRQIQRGMKVRLKDVKDREDAAQQWMKATQETLRILDEIDPSKQLLSKMPLPPKDKMH